MIQWFHDDGIRGAAHSVLHPLSRRGANPQPSRGSGTEAKMANESKKNQKSGKTTIETAKLQAIAEKLGLSAEPKAGWINYFVQQDETEKRNNKRILVHTSKKS